MNTLLKVNLLTDDEAIPTDLRDKITALLREVVSDDPEGVEDARVSLEWKHTVHTREYMESLPPTPKAERISLPGKRSTKAAAATKVTRGRR